MIKYAAGYVGTLLVLLVVDLIWLGVIAKPLYSKGIGHLMAEQPNLWAAAAFYLVYPVGLIYFSVAPRNGALSWSETLLAAAVFGFIAYATYDLSNLATLKGWPTHLAIIDVVWGTVLSTLAAAGGKAAFDWTAAQALRQAAGSEIRVQANTTKLPSRPSQDAANTSLLDAMIASRAS